MTTIQTQTDNCIEKREIKFIKIMDYEVAKLLSDGGFLYMTENINNSQKVYVFEETEELSKMLKDLCGDENFSGICIAEDDMLCF